MLRIFGLVISRSKSFKLITRFRSWYAVEVLNVKTFGKWFLVYTICCVRWMWNEDNETCWIWNRCGWKHIIGGPIAITLYYFLGVPCLNFNHVNIMKDFHNVFTYCGRSKPKEIKCQKITFFYFMWSNVKVYLCPNKYVIMY
jgi:hypothetical protein